MTKDSKLDAWMPLYVGDWDGDTAHLDCEQDGAYGRLVRHYWRNGPLPDDDAQLARVVRMNLPRWKKIRGVIQAFFIIVNGRWTHKRVDAELIKWAEKRRRFLERASAGGKAKAASTKKMSAKSSATSTPQAVLNECTSPSSIVERTPNSVLSHNGRESDDARPDGPSSPRLELVHDQEAEEARVLESLARAAERKAEVDAMLATLPGRRRIR